MRIKSLFATFLTGLALFSALDSAASFGADWKILPGHVPVDLSKVQVAGRVMPTNRLRLAIGVPLRDVAGLDDFLAQLQDPASANFRKYLTPEEFTARFGPTEQDYEAVKQFALTNGLSIQKTYGNRLVLDVTGPASAVEQALHITLRTYQHPTEARQFFAPDSEPTVAADLAVVDIQGLSDFSKPHPKFKRMARAKAGFKDGSAPDGSGGYFGDDFRNAYVPGTSLTGAGQTVGLLEYDGYYASDIAAYASDAGGGRSSIDVENVYVDDYDGSVQSQGGDSEVSLDIEMAMAIAPGLAQILVFETANGNPQNDLLNAMASSNSVACLSCSWGWSGPSTTTDTIFKLMAAQGQSFFNASGDSDAFTVGANSVNGVDNTNLYNGPSSSPYITQVGGTTLTMSGTGASYASEAVWNWGLTQGAYAGSSGGVSSYYSIPSWQAGISMTSNRGSTTQRNIPDVALTADNVCVYDGGNDGNPADNLGGTSCAAPLWAGFMALVNQQAANLGQAPAGFINPAIYAIGKGQAASNAYAACFHDTTAGNNYWSSSTSLYPAVAGYDLCTGWGTPKGTNLIAALASPLGNLAVSPQILLPFSGIAGGLFAPSLLAFQLTNFSATATKWSLVNTSAWIHLAISNGTLAGYSSATLGVSVTTAANSLKVGTYSASLTVSNQTQKLRQALALTLQVNPALSVSPLQGFTAVGPAGGSFTPNSQSFLLSNASASTQNWKLIRTNAWMSVSATNGVLAAGGQTNIFVSLTTAANALKVGTYAASLALSNQTQKVNQELAFALLVAPALSLSPTQGFTAAGPVGGAFAPSSQSFVLANASGGAQNWKLISTNAWMSVSATNGVLAAGGQTNIVVSLTTAANALKVGTYAASLALSNQTQKVNQELAFALQVAPALSLSPTQGFTAVGPVGGAFAPNSQSFVLANVGGGAQSWKVINPAAWLSVSATNGSVAAGRQTNVTVSLSSVAKTLKAAVYSANLTFTNASGLIAVVPFTLSVGQPLVANGGFETGNFTNWTQSGNLDYTTVIRGNSSYIHSGSYAAALGPSGSPGYLSQTLTTVSGQAYALSLWLRNPTGSTPNWFQVQWNGTTLFDQQDLTATGWTNLQFVVSATSSSSVLQLGFQNEWDFFGLDDISLKATGTTSVKALAGKAGDFRLVGTTHSNSVYQVQFKTNLTQPDWINLGEPVTANAGTLMLTHTNALQSSPQRFYRLLELP